MTPYSETITLAAGEARIFNATAQALSIESATLPVTVAFNGGPGQSCKAGSVFEQGFRVINFTNPQAVAVTLTFWLGDTARKFSPADNSASNAQTYLYGNCGLANSGSGPLPNAGGTTTTVTCDALGYLAVPNSPNILVAGTNSSHRRQFVTFSVKAASTFALNVLDLNGNTFLTVQPGQIVQVTTDADIYVSGAGGTCNVTIGQVFLSQN